MRREYITKDMARDMFTFTILNKSYINIWPIVQQQQKKLGFTTLSYSQRYVSGFKENIYFTLPAPISSEEILRINNSFEHNVLYK